MREVYAISAGITSCSRLDYPLTEIACCPAMSAMRDCGINKIDHVYVANMGASRLNRQTGLASTQYEKNYGMVFYEA